MGNLLLAGNNKLATDYEICQQPENLHISVSIGQYYLSKTVTYVARWHEETKLSIQVKNSCSVNEFIKEVCRKSKLKIENPDTYDITLETRSQVKGSIVDSWWGVSPITYLNFAADSSSEAVTRFRIFDGSSVKISFRDDSYKPPADNIM